MLVPVSTIILEPVTVGVAEDGHVVVLVETKAGCMVGATETDGIGKVT